MCLADTCLDVFAAITVARFEGRDIMLLYIYYVYYAMQLILLVTIVAIALSWITVCYKA